MVDPLTTLPDWLRYGLGLGGLLSVLIALLFVLGTRAFPDRERAGAGDRGETKRRREIRAYLRSIGEPVEEDRLLAGRVVAFYLPERDVAITFDARAYFELERAGHRAVLAEHELPGAHIGHRLPFEVPEVEPDEETLAWAFATLGLPPSASPGEIRAAYRERVKETHPDRGGDPEAFGRVRRAYDLVRDRE